MSRNRSKSRPDRVAAAAGETPPAARGFDATHTWVFDLDNTLYPASCDLFAEVDQRMGEFIQKFLGVPFEYARHLQKTYYRQFGTTLAGMMKVHKMDPEPFLAYVHDIDLTPVRETPALAAALAALPGRKLIFTAGSRKHAERVAGKLGVLSVFEDICDIRGTNFVPKSEAAAYHAFFASHGIEAAGAAMFEDMPQNLAPAHALGMTAVLVHSGGTHDSPVQRQIRDWTGRPAHIDHMTSDLMEFLGQVALSRA